MLLKKSFLVTTLLFFFIPTVLAKEAAIFDLGEIVVSQDGEPTFETPSTVGVSSEDIEAKSAESVDEALDFIPGVRVTVGQKNESHVMLRGFNQDDLLILLDGIPISSPYYGFVDLDHIPTESISKIKVIKGAASVLYGANTMGGVINIITKKPGEKPHLELKGSLSDNDTRQFILNSGARYKDISFWVSASHRESDGFDLSEDFTQKRNEEGGLRENSFYDKNALSLKLGYVSKDKYDVTAFFNYIDNEKGIPMHATSTRPRYWRFAEWKRWMGALAGELKLTDNFSVKSRVFYDKYDNTLESYDDGSYSTQSANSSWTSIFDEYAFGSSIYLFFNPDKVHFLKGAANFKKDMHKEQDDAGLPWEKYGINTYSFGLEDDMALGEKLLLSIGLSYDIFEQVETSLGRKGENIDSFNPLCIINYSLTPEALVYSSVSKKTNFPTINQLYSQTSGNPDLKEQENINYEAGIRYDFKDIATLEGSYFYNDVEDLIERASRNDPYLNIAKAVFEGVEASINTKITRYLLVRAGYTYLDARDKNPSLFGRSEEELQYVPKHKGDLELKVLTDFGTSINLLSSYHGERYYYDGSNIQHALGGYFIWNCKVSQEFLENLEGSISIENIFDRNYQEEEGYPQPGRTFLFSLKAEF